MVGQEASVVVVLYPGGSGWVGGWQPARCSGGGGMPRGRLGSTPRPPTGDTTVMLLLTPTRLMSTRCITAYDTTFCN